MTKAEISRLVNEGFALDRTIKEQSKRLDEIKEVLTTAANGKECSFAGEGCAVKIAFYPGFARTLDPAKEKEARELAGTFFNKLFSRSPIRDFAKVAAALVPETAGKLVKLLSGPEAPRVSFKEA